MAQVVETHRPDARVATGGLEALGHLAAVKRLTRVRVGEDEVVVGAVCGAARPRLEGARGPVGHRDRAPRREVGLAIGGMLAAHERVAHPDALRAPVDVAPAQAEELALAQAAKRRDEDQDAKHRSQHVGRRRWRGPTPAATRRCPLAVHDLIRDRADHRVELLDREELQVGVGVALAPAPGAGGPADGVLAHQARSIACSKIECKKVMTLRTVLGARPLSSIALATASIWAVVTSLTGLLPRRGETCTRCIDSQPSR